MKRTLTVAIVASVAMILMFYPVVSSVTIIKSDIVSNRPFAGCLNDMNVGSELCCKYWLDKDSQPDTAVYHITKPLGLGLLGIVYEYEAK